MVIANVFYFLGPLHRNVNHCYNIWSTMFISYLSSAFKTPNLS